MSQELDISWKVLLLLPESQVNYQEPNNLFNIRGGNSFINKMGGTKKGHLNLKPVVLEPTNVFHNAINKVRKKLGFTGAKFPYRTDKEEDLNINIRLYGTRVVILTVKLSSIPFESDECLLELQKIKSHENIHELLLHINGLIFTGNHKSIQNRGSVNSYSCLNIINNSRCKELISDSTAVEVLTGHKGIKKAIVSEILAKNNKHTPYEITLLIDKQGVFFQVPYELSSNQDVTSIFDSVALMFEYSIALSNLISSGSMCALSKEESESICKAITHPDSIFTESVSVRKVWRLLIDEFKLKEQLERHIETAKLKNEQLVEESEVKPKVKPKDWSAKRLFLYGLMITIFTGVLGFKPTKNYLESVFEYKQINLAYPTDGEVIESMDGKINLEWEDRKGIDKYIIFVEVRSKKDNKWYPTNKGDRFTSFTNSKELELALNSYYRWKVYSSTDKSNSYSDLQFSFFHTKEKLKAENYKQKK
jgi:hypothetical protein